MVHAYLNEIGTAVPANESQQEFLDTLESWIPDVTFANKLRVIAKRSGIERRYTVLDQAVGVPGSGAFYEAGRFPGTAKRMEVYQRKAPGLALQAVRALEARGVELATTTHLVITSCTGFYAPGLDIDLIRLLKLSRDVRRTIIGFMGCHAGITGLRNASDIVRANPEAQVLLINLELCTLHLQQDASFDQLVASMLFSDGCAASVISSRPQGFRLDTFSSGLSLEDADRMSWSVGDTGFTMKLDAEIPERIRDYLSHHARRFDRAMQDAQSLWAIHPGGRAILDAVRTACSLSAEQIAPARKVLANYGNMSSASVLFVFEELLRTVKPEQALPGGAVAFGPGLTLELLEFTLVPDRHGPAVELPTHEFVRV